MIRAQITAIISALLPPPAHPDTPAFTWLDMLDAEPNTPTFPPSQIPDDASAPPGQALDVDPVVAHETQALAKFQRTWVNTKIYLVKDKKPVAEIVKILDDALEVILFCRFCPLPHLSPSFPLRRAPPCALEYLESRQVPLCQRSPLRRSNFLPRVVRRYVLHVQSFPKYNISLCAVHNNKEMTQAEARKASAPKSIPPPTAGKKPLPAPKPSTSASASASTSVSKAPPRKAAAKPKTPAGLDLLNAPVSDVSDIDPEIQASYLSLPPPSGTVAPPRSRASSQSSITTTEVDSQRPNTQSGKSFSSILIQPPSRPPSSHQSLLFAWPHRRRDWALGPFRRRSRGS